MVSEQGSLVTLHGNFVRRIFECNASRVFLAWLSSYSSYDNTLVRDYGFGAGGDSLWRLAG